MSGEDGRCTKAECSSRLRCIEAGRDTPVPTKGLVEALPGKPSYYALGVVYDETALMAVMNVKRRRSGGAAYNVIWIPSLSVVRG